MGADAHRTCSYAWARGMRSRPCPQSISSCRLWSSEALGAVHGRAVRGSGSGRGNAGVRRRAARGAARRRAPSPAPRPLTGSRSRVSSKQRNHGPPENAGQSGPRNSSTSAGCPDYSPGRAASVSTAPAGDSWSRRSRKRRPAAGCARSSTACRRGSTWF